MKFSAAVTSILNSIPPAESYVSEGVAVYASN